jgi:hypothetical protein
MEDFWDESDEFTGPQLTEQMVRDAERRLGYKLPESYLQLIRSRNGGTPKRRCFPTQEPTSWAEDHIYVCGIRGVGGEWGIDSESLGSRYMIEEWEYPDVGVVIGETPSGGHDTVMLDYSECGPMGEPRVIHVETEVDEPEVLVIAANFQTFIDGLVDCDQFEAEEDDA